MNDQRSYELRNRTVTKVVVIIIQAYDSRLKVITQNLAQHHSAVYRYF
jgi:hypothetical protein